MSWYLTIRSDSDYSRAIDPRGLVTFLRSLPELVQADGERTPKVNSSTAKDGSDSLASIEAPVNDLIPIGCQ